MAEAASVSTSDGGTGVKTVAAAASASTSDTGATVKTVERPRRKQQKATSKKNRRSHRKEERGVVRQVTRARSEWGVKKRRGDRSG